MQIISSNYYFQIMSLNTRDYFLKSVYFYVITLTTVGLGDISMTLADPASVLLRVLFHFCVGKIHTIYTLK